MLINKFKSGIGFVVFVCFRFQLTVDLFK